MDCCPGDGKRIRARSPSRKSEVGRRGGPRSGDTEGCRRGEETERGVAVELSGGGVPASAAITVATRARTKSR